MPTKRRAPRQFGRIQKLPSGNYRARYIGPDEQLHTGPTTYSSRDDAEAWLTDERRLISSGDWSAPAARKTAAKNVLRFGPYAEDWLKRRELRPRTASHYRSLLDRQIMPTFKDEPLRAITAEQVDQWHDSMRRTPTLRAHAYSLLRTMLHDAVARRLIPANPCNVKGGGAAKRKHRVEPATIPELTTLTEAMPTRYRPMVLLAAWCALRFGELAELRRSDIDVKNAVIHVRRGVVRVDGETLVGKPKSDAGIRDVAIPPHLIPMLKDHLVANVNGRSGLLFPAADGTSHLAPSTLYKVYYPAREAAGRTDLRFHDLRHTGAVLAASTGATLAELMARLGHSTAGAAMRYQHAAKDRDKIIAAKLSELAGGAE